MAAIHPRYGGKFAAQQRTFKLPSRFSIGGYKGNLAGGSADVASSLRNQRNGAAIRRPGRRAQHLIFETMYKPRSTILHGRNPDVRSGLGSCDLITNKHDFPAIRRPAGMVNSVDNLARLSTQRGHAICRAIVSEKNPRAIRRVSRRVVVGAGSERSFTTAFELLEPD